MRQPTERPYFRTFTGRHVHTLDPHPGEVNIFDIARSLSQQCRFLGHTQMFYSVAQHSVLVSDLVLPHAALWGLLHDAAEAYLGDLPKPIKETAPFLGYREAEARVLHAICLRYDLPTEMPAVVKWGDRQMLATEFRYVTGVEDDDWIKAEVGFAPLDRPIYPWEPRAAETQFLDRFVELTQ
jgi:hypothetical protein